MINALKFFIRNKHSDYPEVLFSSVLSNLLDPEVAIVFKDQLIKYIFDKYFGPNTFQKGELSSEKSLGNAGSIDIYYKAENFILGIEVKIWDRSANNKDGQGIDQLVRYAIELEKSKLNWILLYVVPTSSSRICREEYEKAKTKFRDHIYMLPWNLDANDSNIEKMDESLLDILQKLKPEVNKDTISEWIYNSLVEIIPDLIEEIPEPKKFPNKREILQIPELSNIYSALFKYYSVWPNPLHSTIGVPIGKGDQKSRIHNNCLFRIRTTKDYYYKIEEKIKYLPKDFVEFEIWMDIYNKIENELNNLVSNYNFEIKPDKHLDQNKNIEVKVIKLFPGTNFIGFINELDLLLRKAVNLVVPSDI